MSTPPANSLTVPQQQESNPPPLPAGSAPTAKTALVLANLIPLAGVLLLDWDLFAIVLVYWLENGVIGFFNLIKILMARGPVRLDRLAGSTPSPDQQAQMQQAMAQAQRYAAAGRFFLAPFFLVHYGIFWIVHGVFVFVLFSGRIDLPFAPATADPIGWWGIAVMLAALAGSHGVSFFHNFIGRREYERISAPEQMFQPYGRVIVLHLAILGGAFLIMLIGAPLGALVLLIVLKTALDLRAHAREHRRQ